MYNSLTVYRVLPILLNQHSGIPKIPLDYDLKINVNTPDISSVFQFILNNFNLIAFCC